MKGSDNSSDREAEATPSSSTSATLIEKVKQGDRQSWERLMTLYRPLVQWWCRSRVTRREDAEDIAQDVFKAVFRKIDTFTKRQHHGGFRAWLRKITYHKIGDYLSGIRKQPAAAGGSDAQEILAELPDEFGDDSSTNEEPSERVILLHSALELIRPEFESKTWEAAMRTLLEGQPTADVAAALGMTTNAVLIAKSRVLTRLREEMGTLLD
jgi:RNA polymerase sigma-70 factor (ECF subfamily)